MTELPHAMLDWDLWSLREESSLLVSVEDGLGALRNPHRDYLDDAIRGAFADSLDVDEALKAGHEQENRWDYLLGHAPSAEVVALEPHSAKQDEITTVIKKRRAALDQLKDHLKVYRTRFPGHKVALRGDT